MIKRVFRPFWRYNVVATEEWLAGMAAAGFLLQSVDYRRRVFVFEKRQPQELIYRVDYSKEEKESTPTLKKEGWREISTSRRWHILVNQNPEPSLFPSREGVIKKTRTLLTVSCVLLALSGFYLTVLAVVMIGIALSSDFEVEYIPAPYPILDLFPYAALATNAVFLAWIIYTFIQTKKGLTRLSVMAGYSLYPTLIKVDSRLIQDPPDLKNLVKLTRRFWFYNLDRLTSWLESQAARGMLLKFIDKNGFYFEKDRPRKIKYFVDAQQNITAGYFDIHKQAGFTLLCDLSQPFGRIFIWSKEQAETDTEPEFYTDRAERFACARRLLLINLKWILYWLGIGGLNLFFSLSSLRTQGINQIFWVLLALLWLIVMILYLHPLYLSLVSYLREKRKFFNCD
jgi:hypothetical protein